MDNMQTPQTIFSRQSYSETMSGEDLKLVLQLLLLVMYHAHDPRRLQDLAEINIMFYAADVNIGIVSWLGVPRHAGAVGSPEHVSTQTTIDLLNNKKKQ